MNNSFAAPRRQSPSPQRRVAGSTSVFGRGGGSKNRTWVSGAASSSKSRDSSPVPLSEGRWERGGHSQRSSRGRGGRAGAAGANGHHPPSLSQPQPSSDPNTYEMGTAGTDGPTLPSGNVVKTWEELVKEREIERARAIRDGKMDDPSIAKRLEDAITIVGVCQDMCPEFERYRRERENNLDRWECIVGPDGKATRRVDHARAVKIYERGQGDKIIPSDLRPAPVLKRTLDYLFHTLLPEHPFTETQAFIRDRSRAVRNDFTIQQDMGPVAMECFERCARFHILSLHLMHGQKGFNQALEIQQLMNSLLSLKESYDDHRESYQSPNELEMRIYHRLGLIRDQHERNDKPPEHIAMDPAFQLVTLFRSQVQTASAPITKQSQLRVSNEAMATFGQLVSVLKEKHGDGRGHGMIYLVACFLENIFGKGTVPESEMEGIRGDLTVNDIIDGTGGGHHVVEEDRLVADHMDGVNGVVDEDEDEAMQEDDLAAFIDDIEENEAAVEDEAETSTVSNDNAPPSSPLKRGATEWLNDNFGNAPPRPSSLGQHFNQPSTSSAGQDSTHITHPSPQSAGSVFNTLVTSSANPTSAFQGTNRPVSVFGSGASSSPFGTENTKSVFGGTVFGDLQKASQSSSPSVGGIFSQPLADSNSSSSLPPSTTAAHVTESRSEPFNLPKDIFGASASSTTSDSGIISSARNEQHETLSSNVQAASTAVDSTAFKPSPFAAPFIPRSHSSSTPPQKVSVPPILTDSIFHPSPSSTPTHEVSAGQAINLPDMSSTPSSLAFPSTPVLTSGTANNRSSTNGKNAARPLSINTGTSTWKPVVLRKSVAMDSPIGPPSLGRQAPISLPSTPTGTSSAAPLDNSMQAGPSNSISAIHFPGKSSVGLGLIDMPHSQTPVNLMVAESPVSSLTRAAPSLDVVTNLSDEADKRVSTSLFKPTNPLRFATLTVRDSFKKWRARTASVVAWRNACQRSEAYKRHLLAENSPSTLLRSPSPSSKRRRESVDLRAEPVKTRRRLKSRLQECSVPRTDEQLAERLRENKKENERRWARGSFVRAIRERLGGSHDQSFLPYWKVWLSMNTENDQTAIWLEQKFNVPDSGTWTSETIFSINVSDDIGAVSFPGLLVFECSPLENVGDELERKYRVLDDCSRLRDVIASLPILRHFIPSIITIVWGSGEGVEAPKDITDMLNSYRRDRTILDHVAMSISSSEVDFDEGFSQTLSSLKFDLKGELVEWLPLQDVFERLATKWREASSMWVDACNSEDQFNWRLFSRMSSIFVNCINSLAKVSLDLWSSGNMEFSPLPQLDFEDVNNELLIVNDLRNWLQSPVFDHDYLSNHLSASDFNEDFDARSFFKHLLNLVFLHLQRHTPTFEETRAVTNVRLEDAVMQLNDFLEKSQKKLREAAKSLPRVSLKRNSNGFTSGYSSNASSPSPITSPVNGAKRQRLSDVSDITQPPSPTPSHASSAADSSASVVTLSMLRNLARDVLKTYGKKPAS